MYLSMFLDPWLWCMCVWCTYLWSWSMYLCMVHVSMMRQILLSWVDPDACIVYTILDPDVCIMHIFLILIHVAMMHIYMMHDACIYTWSWYMHVSLAFDPWSWYIYVWCIHLLSVILTRDSRSRICHLSFDRCLDIWRFWNWIFNDHSNRPQQFSD